MTDNTGIDKKPSAPNNRYRLVWLYGIGYVALIVLYLVFIFTGSYSMSPDDYLTKSFPKRTADTAEGLARAAMDAGYGERTPADVRFAQTLTFIDVAGDPIAIKKGDRITLPQAVQLGLAILADEKKPAAARMYTQPFSIYYETPLATLDWAYWLTFYNLVGFFLLIAVFLGKPIGNYLVHESAKVSQAIINAKQAEAEAIKLRDRYNTLVKELELQKNELLEAANTDVNAESERIIATAHSEAKAILSGVQEALDAEIHSVTERLRTETIKEASRQALAIVTREVRPSDHESAIETFVRDAKSKRNS